MEDLGNLLDKGKQSKEHKEQEKKNAELKEQLEDIKKDNGVLTPQKPKIEGLKIPAKLIYLDSLDKLSIEELRSIHKKNNSLFVKFYL